MITNLQKNIAEAHFIIQSAKACVSFTHPQTNKHTAACHNI